MTNGAIALPSLLPLLWEKVARIDRCATDEGSLSAETCTSPARCEPLNMHALLPTRQFVPAKVRVFLDALDAHAYVRPTALADL
jgi:hypothetical protein